MRRSYWLAKLLPLVPLIGCEPGPMPDFVTERGVFVYTRGYTSFTKEVADEMDAYIVAHVPDAEECLRLMSATIFSLEELAARYPRAKPSAGFQYDNHIHVAEIGPCPWNSAYVHEAAHWLQQCQRGVYDINHTVEPDLWRIVSSRPQECKE